MAVMCFLKSECVNYECFHTIQISIFFITHRLHISNIGKLTKPIAENRHLIVHHTDRNKLNIPYLIMLMRMNGMQFEFRSSRIEFFCILRKAVRHRMRQPRSNDFIAIDIDITKDTERAQIINTTNMVVMDMRNQDAIYLSERHT